MKIFRLLTVFSLCLFLCLSVFQGVFPTQGKDNKCDMCFIVGSAGYKGLIADAAGELGFNVTVYTSEEISRIPASLRGYDIIFLEMLDGATIFAINDLVVAAKEQNNATVVTLSFHDAGLGTVNRSSAEYDNITRYWKYKGDENMRRLAVFLAATYKGAPLEVLPPVPKQIYGLYHPDAPKIFTTTEEYIDWYKSTGRYNPDKPTIGINNNEVPADSLQSKVEDTLIRDIESKGFNAIFASFYYKDPNCTTYFIQNDTSIVDTVISLKKFIYWSYDQQKGVEYLKKLNVPVLRGISCYYMSPAEWENSTSLFNEMGFQIALPEFDGVFEPIVIGGKAIDPDTGNKYYEPIDHQINWIVNRSIRHAQLRHKPENDTKVAVIYYNHGGGKNNFGAMYLDIAPSLTNLLNNMSDAGYDISNKTIPNGTELIDLMIHQGRNIGTWAPGELDKMVASGDVVLWPQEKYMTWFNALPTENKEAVIERWGPAPGEIMVYANESGSYFVIPRIEFGNVILTPQPSRGWFTDNDILYHSKELVPHHQYLAYYFWLQHEYKADAIIHFGTHGTQEWLPGKESGLSRYDWPSIMVGDMPVVYPYIMDNVGEGIQTKRRGNAVIVDHLTSPIIEAGLYGKFINLDHYIKNYNTPSIEEPIKAAYKATIIQDYIELGLEETLDVSPSYLNNTNETQFDYFLEDTLEPYVEDLRTQSMPYGMHILGEPPADDQSIQMIRLMLGQSYIDAVEATNTSQSASIRLLEAVLLNSTSTSDAQYLILGQVDANITAFLNDSIMHYQNILLSTQEITNTLRGLDGQYIEPRGGNCPIINPDSLPTGINFHSVDPRLLPGVGEWNVGKQLTNQLLADYMADTGRYPEKVGFVTCSVELIRHRGVTESEILYLLGVKPVWSSKGRISGLELIPEDELGRPRIDVMLTSSGLYRDMFPDKLLLVDEAVRLAANASNSTYPNYVKQHSQVAYQKLIDLGYSKEDAKRLSESRVVGRSPGVYGTGLEEAIPASNSWEDDSKLANLYIENLGNLYGQDMWGESNTDVFKMMLDGVDIAIHSLTTNQFGTLDNNDFVAWHGGLALGVREVAGQSPIMYVNNLMDPTNRRVEKLSTVLDREIRSRYVNPNWINGMQESGYAGAREMDRFVGFLWDWQVTNPELISDAAWERVYNTYILDEHNLGMKDFFGEANPYALQAITARMLEAERKGYWNTSDDVLESLVREYAESVAEHGVTCCHHTCGNPLLREYIAGILSAPGVISTGTAVKYNKEVLSAAGKGGVGAEEVVKVGKVMEEVGVEEGFPVSATPLVGVIAAIVILLVIYAGYKLGGRKRSGIKVNEIATHSDNSYYPKQNS